MNVISLDTETTGLDLHHGARPFLVTLCDPEGNNVHWEWDVDVFTRMPVIPPGDVEEIAEHINAADVIVVQNGKFDMSALRTIGLWDVVDIDTVWPKLWDTLLAGHLLASSHKHDLTSMGVQYLNRNILHFEEDMQEATNKARNMVRNRIQTKVVKNAKGQDRKKATWRIADRSLPEMPSAKEKVWRYDTWLPRAVCMFKWFEEKDLMYAPYHAINGDVITRKIDLDDLDEDKSHPWWSVTTKYANADSFITVRLYPVMLRHIKRR
jgi:hypothetical protein